MPGGVPNTNNIRNVPRLPNSSALYWGGQSNWTHLCTPQRVHSHQQHWLTRATTQEFLVFICHPEPQLKRCHSEPQLKGYVSSHNSRNTSKPTFEISPKPCRPRTFKASKLLLPHQYCLALLTSRQAHCTFRCYTSTSRDLV